MSKNEKMIINRPHALYYNGELIAIITNPDPFGSAVEIADALSPDQGAAEVRPIDPDNLRLPDRGRWALVEVLEHLGVDGELDGELDG